MVKLTVNLAGKRRKPLGRGNMERRAAKRWGLGRPNALYLRIPVQECRRERRLAVRWWGSAAPIFCSKQFA
nr:hypothetical protein [Paenibacillus woosongensis]